jgi:alkanesulfonate monooxygenase SsuD/methylene tetrahydromethanopterin reductase-like flavin-dependent oxidoreductase (luciferase family)
VAESEDQAWADMQDHLFNSMEYYGEILAEANDVPGDKDIWRFKSPSEMRHALSGRIMIGAPDQVARQIERFQKNYQCTHFVMGVQMPGMDPAKVTHSLELFAKEVMPSFRQ